MEEYITPERTANAIMQDTSFKGYYLIVEGKKDIKLYGKFINKSDIQIKPAFGNKNVKKVIEILDERKFSKRFGIIDSDFKKILNIKETIDGLFITDDHDVEMMIIKTKALEDVLNVFCSKTKISTFEKNTCKSIRDSILELGKEVGYLKLANKVYDLGLVFKPDNPEGKQLKYSNIVCNTTFNFLGKEKLIETVTNYSRNKRKKVIDYSETNKRYEEFCEQDIDLFQLVNGHDLSNFLYILMKKILKSRNKMLVNYNSVEDSLILAYDYSSFKQTDLYNDIINWAKDKDFNLLENNAS
jgi:hypothetical protein